MKHLSAIEIRRTWLNFFKSHGHHIEPGASLIPHNDPTLLWINSGVAALKKYFDGSEVPPSRRITNVQKSIRTNDIENVGKTARHHTFFEMLGNFSIGDYFREEVLEWALDILTNEKYFGLDKEKIYFTYHPNDKDTLKRWKSLGVNESNLIPLEGNFWQIGEGPCGPNTEVFYDRGEKYDPEGLGLKLLTDDIENDRYIEIWGIVFSQFNGVNGVPREEYKELPSKNIDTGAGLERIACILQETETNFETDLFMPIIKTVESLAEYPYDKDHLMAYRVIADHIRAVTFAICDGEIFSNEGRGYVLRRLLRRAMVYARTIGITKPFMFELVNVVASNYKEFYPQLENRISFISKIVKSEEEKFISTLTSGQERLNELLQDKTVLSGEDAFKLYDTYGFPIDLTNEICAMRGVTVDMDGFKEEMNKQKERARAARNDAQSMSKQSADLLAYTETSNFLYSETTLQSKVIALFKDGVKVDSLDDYGDVVFDNTCFYAESGGQVSDTGTIENENTSCLVEDVQHAPNKQNLHHVKVLYGSINVGDEFTLKIDTKKRLLTMRNHSAAHLLDQTLFDVLGEHVAQQGSYVSSEYLRFDFNHYEKINEETLANIERIVNEKIAEALEVKVAVLPIEEAKKLGAKALFTEKYGDTVRVVLMGDYSKEFCGGTHVSNTEEIGIFAIESEESIASGTRRIIARTSLGAYELFKKRKHILDKVKNKLGAKSIFECEDRLNSLSKQKDTAELNERRIITLTSSVLAKYMKNSKEVINGYDVFTSYMPNFKREGITELANNLVSGNQNAVAILAGGVDKDIPLVIVLGENVVKNGNQAGQLVKELSVTLGGSGGGRPQYANGSGKDLSKLNEALNSIKGKLK